jgi:hypothetical protein
MTSLPDFVRGPVNQLTLVRPSIEIAARRSRALLGRCPPAAANREPELNRCRHAPWSS